MSAATNRNDKFTKLYKVAKKEYTPVLPPANRNVLEHLVYACLLEDSPYEAADEVFAKLQVEYFDWNEIRVTTTNELSEQMKNLHDPIAAANRLRKSLHGLFESHYSFNIEFLRKENLGKAIDQLNKYKGVSPFGISYVVQHALGGHSIPIDQALIKLMYTIGAIDEHEAEQAKVPGMERAIPKTKGTEFASLVHQMAVQFQANPFDNKTRTLILQVEPESTERFPKRGGRKKAEKEEPTAADHSAASAKKTPSAKKKQPASGKSPTRKPLKKKAGPKGVAVPKKKSTTKKLARKKPR